MLQMTSNPSQGTCVVQPHESQSYWLPFPANGFVDLTLMPGVTGFDGLSMGYENIPPGSRVPEHAHAEEVELQICFRGSGTIIADGIEHRLVPGTTCFLKARSPHAIVNDSGEDLVMLWLVIPGGLEKRFQQIGRPRSRGDAAPEPFAGPYGAPAKP
jgi:quercetin dioxygenase-like cupin family protein